MERIKSFSAEELIGTIVNYGADPFIIETIEQAEELQSSIDNATSYNRITREEEDFETICAQLDLSPDKADEVWSMVDGSVFVLCFGSDWNY